MSEFIQIHFLTSYPPANLNRDDLGRPKTAMMGGAQRLRVSSQSLKRAWRTSEVFEKAFENKLGTRTKDLGNLVFEELTKRKVDPEKADRAAKQVAGVFGKLKGGAADPAAEKAEGKKGKAKKVAAAEASGREGRQIEQLAFVTAGELAAVRHLINRVAEGHEPTDEECEALLSPGHGSVDVALFGRMLAARPEKNVEAAAQVAHALSVHKVTVEDDYFTAVDDLNQGIEDVGAGHIGTTEFAAGLFYGYVCVDRSLLSKNLDGNEELAKHALRALVEACATVAPSGKQASFGSRARASWMLVERGEEQPRSLSVAFLAPVEGKDMLAEAIQAVSETREKMEKVYGPCAKESASFDAHQGKGTLQAILDFVSR